jgi:hypothetical protein
VLRDGQSLMTVSAGLPARLRALVGDGVSVIVAAEMPDPERLDDQTVLDDLGYRLEAIGGRRTLRPNDTVWDKTVTGVEIVDVPRADAAHAYALEARQQVRELDEAGFAGGVVRGDPREPMFTDLVTLSREARVVEHLVELLGQDADLVFTVEPASLGLLLSFERPDAS